MIILFSIIMCLFLLMIIFGYLIIMSNLNAKAAYLNDDIDKKSYIIIKEVYALFNEDKYNKFPNFNDNNVYLLKLCKELDAVMEKAAKYFNEKTMFTSYPSRYLNEFYKKYNSIHDLYTQVTYNSHIFNAQIIKDSIKNAYNILHDYYRIYRLSQYVNM